MAKNIVIELAKRTAEKRIPYVDTGAMAFCSQDNMIIDGLRNAWLDGFKYGQRLSTIDAISEFDLDSVKKVEKEEVG